jgi:internalin A
MPAAPVARPWRRFLRFTVRGLIVFVIVVGAGLGWIVRQAHIQRDAVAAIRKAGGTATYDWEWRDAYTAAAIKKTKGNLLYDFERYFGEKVEGGRPWAPKWLVDVIGADYFGHVAYVGLYPKVNLETAIQIGRLTRLQELWLNQSSVGDVEIEQFKELRCLVALLLRDTQMTDAGLAHLKGLRKLSYLNAGRTRVTDAGLAHLTSLTELKSLGLDHTQVTDAGLAHLRGLAKLSNLDLKGTQVTDGGVKELQQALPRLKIER